MKRHSSHNPSKVNPRKPKQSDSWNSSSNIPEGNDLDEFAISSDVTGLHSISNADGIDALNGLNKEPDLEKEAPAIKTSNVSPEASEY